MALALLCALALLTGWVRPAAAQIDPIILGHAVDATVQLSIVVRGTVDDREQVIWYAVGSGTIVSPGGLILTNNHLIAPAGVNDKLAELEQQLAAEGKEAHLEVEPDRFMVASSDGRHLPEPRYLAWVAATDPDLDLAILRIDADRDGVPLDGADLSLPAVPLGDSDAVNLGDPVHVFGFPAIGSGSLTYTTGVVSGFLFEEEIDGTAWINSDAVTSGGNSGGAALNSSGQLIGIPTSGSALDCRVGDTNRDGTIGPEDVGCLPTGGSLTQLRPINLARPLLEGVDAAVAGEIGTSVAATLTPESDPLAANLAAARGCAARGDWRCATNFYRDAVANAPDDSSLLTDLYDAYLALGRQEAAAGRLDSARVAFQDAQRRDPSRADAEIELARIAPYRSAIALDSFDGDKHFLESENDGVSSSYRDGAFILNITEAGRISSFPLTKAPLEGQNYAAVLDLRRTSGDGMVTFETHTDPDGGQFVFAVDPGNRTWEVLEYSSDDAQFVPWAGAFSFPDTVSGDVASIELRVTEGFPLLLVNGVDLAAAASTPLPEIGAEGELWFGALMSSEGSEPFVAEFDAIALYELA
ncbi:MAG: trypsin-like peptidase domain-containing protein [Chloroflexota bacterium]|nr:trypsin-like peptidase domain-containing protein [Chloroflexota bacterium]